MDSDAANGTVVDGGGGMNRTDALGKCSGSSPAVVKALVHFIATVARDGGVHAGTQDEGPEGSHFHVNETHFAAWTGGEPPLGGPGGVGGGGGGATAAVCAVSKEDLRRLGFLTPVAIRDPLYIVVPITCMYALIFLFGLVGNVSTCVVIARNRHMHTATNYYLFSLALSDLLLLVSGLPPEICHIWFRYPYLFGEVFCFLQGFAAETSANATVLTITAFTMERYVAICRPFRARAMSSPPRAVRCVLASWALALVLAVPPATQFGVVERKDVLGTDMSECTVKRVVVNHAFLLSTGLVFVAPLLVISVLYILIGLRLRRSRRALAARRHSAGSTGSVRARSASSASSSSAHSQARVIRMLVAVVVAFFICWAPFHAQRLLAVYATKSSQQHEAVRALYTALTYMSGVLYYLSTTVNPVLYHIMSNKFREAFKNTLRTECGWWSRRGERAVRRQSYASLSVRGHHAPSCRLRAGAAQPCCGCAALGHGHGLGHGHAHCAAASSACCAACAACAACACAGKRARSRPLSAERSSSCALTLTTTFDERSNTYSTVEERGGPAPCIRSASLGRARCARKCCLSCEQACPPGCPQACPLADQDDGCCPAGRRAASRTPPSDNGRTVHVTHGHRANGNGLASGGPAARPKPGQPLCVTHPAQPAQTATAGPASPSSTLPPPSPAPSSPTSARAPSRSPIEALARKLRAARSGGRSVRWHVGGEGRDNGGGGLRPDHSAISNSSLQEWDRSEGGAELAELAELVQYMGELNQRHGAKPAPPAVLHSDPVQAKKTLAELNKQSKSSQ